MEASLDLIMVFFSLKNYSYEKAMLLQFLIYGYWKSTNHPAWKLVHRNPHSILEEDGEISLSLLSHAASSHGIHANINCLSRMYRLFNYYRETVAETLLDCKIRVGPKKQSVVKQSDPEVAVAIHHFNGLINHLGNGTWQHYPCFTKKSGGQYEKKQTMSRLLMQSSLPRMMMANYTQCCKESLKRMRALLFTLENTTFWQPENLDSNTDENQIPVMAALAQNAVDAIPISTSSTSSE